MQTAPYNGDAAQNQTGQAHWVMTADGVRIRVAHWPAKEARGTVLIFPGRTEYVEKYGPAAEDLAKRGYASIAIDWRGQGIADRVHENPMVGHVGRFSDYQLDVQAALAHARALGLPEPFHLLAHSMGGAIGLRALYEGLPIQSAAFSAPMWGIAMAPALRPLAWGLSTISRPLRFSGSFAPGQNAGAYVLRTNVAENTLTSDPGMFKLLQDQITAMPEMILGGASLNWLNEALRETRNLSQRPAPATPAVTFLGTDEEIVDPARIHERMATWNNGELVMLSGGRHEVIMEAPDMRNALFDRCVALFDGHTCKAA